MDISIIIVNYKSKGFTLNCLKSIHEADWHGLNYEIIVVDNNSGDNTPDIVRWQYPDVRLIEAKKNLGMGGGNNLGIRQAKGRYVAIMNPDTLVFKDTFQKLFKLMEDNSHIGIVGPKQYNPDRTIQDSCYRWHGLWTPLFRRTALGLSHLGQRDLERFLMCDFDKNSFCDVDWLLGSFLFMRAEALSEVGGFDERFFLYFEDTDICRRFHKKGWRVIYYPDAEIIHNHNRASAGTPWYKFFTSRATRAHVWSWLKYLAKYRGK